MYNKQKTTLKEGHLLKSDGEIAKGHKCADVIKHPISMINACDKVVRDTNDMIVESLDSVSYIAMINEVRNNTITILKVLNIDSFKLIDMRDIVEDSYSYELSYYFIDDGTEATLDITCHYNLFWVTLVVDGKEYPKSKCTSVFEVLTLIHEKLNIFKNKEEK